MPDKPSYVCIGKFFTDSSDCIGQYWTSISISISILSLWLFSKFLPIQAIVLGTVSDIFQYRYWAYDCIGKFQATQVIVSVDTEDFKSLKWYFTIKGIFLCDEAIVLLINLHFEAMKQFFRYWSPLKRLVDTIGRSVSVSEAWKVGTSPTFAYGAYILNDTSPFVTSTLFCFNFGLFCIYFVLLTLIFPYSFLFLPFPSIFSHFLSFPFFNPPNYISRYYCIPPPIYTPLSFIS